MSILKDVIDETAILKVTNNITEHDAAAIVETAGELAVELVKQNPIKYADPEFHDYIYEEVLREVLLQVDTVCYECDFEREIAELVYEGLSLCFVHVYPARSYKITNVLKVPDVGKVSSKLSYLRSVPQEEQRSQGWYEQRHKYLTASSIWKAFGTTSNRNELIYSKCMPLDITKYSRFNLESPLHWGQKYEDLSIMWYQHHFKTSVGEFGCIPHQSLKFLAASPDGINIDPESDRYGRMLEVKNIVNRDITGIPKFEYWIQMQIQLEVCNLNECDFLETRFLEYENYDEFYADGCFMKTANGKPKGIMMLFLDAEKQPKYEYAPWSASEMEVESWQKAKMSENSTCMWLKNIYWKLEDVSVVLVVRNKLWFESARPILDDIWNIIVKEREIGYEHRAPNKRVRKQLAPAEPVIRRCLIDLDNTSGSQSIQQHTNTENIVICIDTQKMQDAHNIQ